MKNEPSNNQASPSRGKAGITVLADQEIRRGLEQRALRNSRGLIDKLEQEQDVDRGLQRKAMWGIAIAGVILALMVVSLMEKNRGGPTEFPKPGFDAQLRAK